MKSKFKSQNSKAFFAPALQICTPLKKGAIAKKAFEF
jgi:hypothetical protein